ncbi:reverse transcriptase [Hordeum vulgare]|nr:reverse transcriptase [Hordeum vulgare]
MAVTGAPSVGVICFNYGRQGHSQVNCKLPLVCYKCKRTDHSTLLYPSVFTEGELRLFGYAVNDLGFFHVNIAMSEALPSLLALITIRCGKTSSPTIITEELRHLFFLDWDSEVTPVLDHELMTVIPDPFSLRWATRSMELTLALNNLTLNINVPTGDPSAVATLSKVWIQVVPAKVKHPHPSTLHTKLRMFFNDCGYDLHMSVVEAARVSPSCLEEASSRKPPQRDDGPGGGSGHDNSRRCRPCSHSSEETGEESPE